MNEEELLLSTKEKVQMVNHYMCTNRVPLDIALTNLNVSLTDYANSVDYLSKNRVEYIHLSRKFL